MAKRKSKATEIDPTKHGFPPKGETIFYRGEPKTIMEIRVGPEVVNQGFNQEEINDLSAAIKWEMRALVLLRGANVHARGDIWVRFEETTGWL